MSFKQALKRKLPFTRKGLEDYLHEQLALMRYQQANDLQDQLASLTEQFAKELNAQLDRRVNDLQSAVIEQLAQELNAQLHRRINDLDNAITLQTEALTERFAEEMNAQLDRRTNDLQSAVIEQLAQELNAQLHRRTNDLDNAITLQTGALTERFAQELNAQLHRRTNDLDRAITGVKNELYGSFHRIPKTMLSFEVALAEHCNLNCVGCNHFSPLAPPSFPNLEEFTRDFKRMSHLFGDRTQQVKLLGGEPLLNPDINRYLRVARECFPQSEIMIITNGLLLPKMGDPFWETCKEGRIVIAPTKYPINFDYKKWGNIIGLL